ncbi:MAG: methyl-accepting chemotaxis protein [Candidatus Omnitrophica bacterium]|nr:methyl-accepting chemotaxis protein [Candidatus Omnitrophota bacterium]MDD5671544.1 methyl-accepting chemotaxis protein [Candidatus Omnitrophota bacterium]
MPKNQGRRKNYFIKKKFQANFFLKFAGLLVSEAALIGALFVYVSRGTLTAAYRGLDFTIEKTSSYFLGDLLVIVCIVGAAIGVMGVFIFMFLSHRIGGALYRFEKTLEDARNGNLSQRVRLRKTDELHDMNTQFNVFLETMDARMAEMKREVEKGIAAAHSMLGDGHSVKMMEHLKQIKTQLEYFKTSK